MPPSNLAPYKIFKVGTKYVVKNNAGETKATFDDRDEALNYLRALYANVPGAPKQADKKKWSGDQKRAVKVKAAFEPQAYSIPLHGFYIAKADTDVCVGCGLDLDSPLHELVEQAADELNIKGKNGRHKFRRQTDNTYKGAGWYPACITCGRPESDPDHDGDNDTAGGTDTDGDARPAAGPVAAAEAPATTEPRVEPAPVEAVETQRAFVTELNGKTLITGTADVIRQMAQDNPVKNKHMLGVNGKFVGAEKANRNGALWTTADLEMGVPSVTNGPLNWLHEARHVIGSIRAAQLFTRNEQTASDLAEPFIGASSVVWRWLYPDEAAVIEMASDANKLYYSMECISENVHCGGCGEQASYADYMHGKAGCQHMRQRSETRRFENPTFLGGAVIVPPVRPGWADAFASAMPQAAQLAEKAYDQAGQPGDITASEWEALMAQVVSFAS